MPRLQDINGKSEEFINAVKSFLKHPKGFFVIAGPNGNGKTFTAQAIFNHLHNPSNPNDNSLFYNTSELFLKWLDDFQKWGSTTYLLNQIITAPLLVLDDLGTRKPSDAFMDFLYIIADKRYSLKHTHGTIITTNLNTTAFRNMFGDAFLSRISSGINVRNEMPDRRAINF